jgi:hypothetical protein
MAFRGESCGMAKIVNHRKGEVNDKYLDDARAKESHDDGHNIDSQLELKELGNAVIDVASPHHGFYNRCEVVVCQNNIRSLLRYISTSNALEKKRWSQRGPF